LLGQLEVVTLAQLLADLGVENVLRVLGHEDKQRAVPLGHLFFRLEIYLNH